MKSSDALRKVADAISRKKDATAVLVPRRVAVALLDEVYPFPSRDDDSNAFKVVDFAVERARDKYLKLVSKGGYIGTIMSIPMVVADDVVVCSLTEQELIDLSASLNVDFLEIKRDCEKIKAAQ